MTLHVPLTLLARVALARRRNALASALVSLAMLVVVQTTPLPAQAPGTSKGLLAPPKNLWAAQTSPTELTLVWGTIAGATGYRIYGSGSLNPISVVAQPLMPNLRWVLNIQRLVMNSGAINLQIEAIDAKGQISPKAAFNPVVPVAKAATPVKVPTPANVLATETAPGVITLTWDAVPGATAYALGRSVQPNGFRSLCAVCPTHTTYVDSGATQPVQHSYSVLAITPNGTSANGRSNAVTPGVGTLASLPGGGTPLAGGTSGPATARPPRGPTNPSAVFQPPNSVVLTWSHDSGTVAYDIDRSISGAPFQRVVRAPAGARFVDAIQGYAPGSNAQYRIIALNSAGTSPAVNFNPITLPGSVATLPPSGATNLKAVFMPPDSVELTWTPDSSATSYQIELSVSRGPFNVVAKGPFTRLVHVIQGSPVGVAQYRLTAFTPTGPSPAVTFNPVTLPGPVATLPPRGPANPRAVLLPPNSVELTWTGDPNAAGYHIHRCIGWSPCQQVATIGGGGRFVDSIQVSAPGGTAQYKIIAFNPSGAAPAVSFNPITLPAPVATLPPRGATNPRAVFLPPDNVELTWTRDPGAASYVIESSISGSPFQIVTNTATGARFIDVVQVPATGGSALYRIIAVNSAGQSPAAAFNTITLPVPKANVLLTGVTSPAAVVTSASSISLSWVPEPAATSYRIERSLSGGPFQLLVTLPGSVPSYVDAVSGLTKQNPKYRIISVNASGMSPAVTVP